MQVPISGGHAISPDESGDASLHGKWQTSSYEEDNEECSKEEHEKKRMAAAIGRIADLPPLAHLDGADKKHVQQDDTDDADDKRNVEESQYDSACLDECQTINLKHLSNDLAVPSKSEANDSGCDRSSTADITAETAVQSESIAT